MDKEDKLSEIQKKLRKEKQDQHLFNKTMVYALKYMSEIDNRKVYPSKEAINNLKLFDENLPDEPTSAEEVIDFLNTNGAPATTAIMGSRYFGFVNGGATPAGLCAKTLGTFWDQNTAMNVISPIAAKLEAVVEGWLNQVLNLPNETVAGFVSGTSTANFCGLAAARYRQLQNLGWNLNEEGLFDAPKLRIVTGKHAHSAILKAISLLGFGKNNIEWVEVDEQGRIIPEAIPTLDESSILILQAGNVNSGSFDPFEKICAKAKAEKAWIHIDGAFGLWAAAVDQLKYLTKGIELADSWAVDGHKTLNTPYDCGISLCKDEEAMISALHMQAAYIILSEERDGMFYTPEMSRRARIIELWATLKNLGQQGIDEMVFGLHQNAALFAKNIAKVDGFTVLNEVVFNQVIVKCNGDELTQQVMERIQKHGVCWVGGSTWFGEKVIRISICSWMTTEADILKTVASFESCLKEILSQD